MIRIGMRTGEPSPCPHEDRRTVPLSSLSALWPAQAVYRVYCSSSSASLITVILPESYSAFTQS